MSIALRTVQSVKFDVLLKLIPFQIYWRTFSLSEFKVFVDVPNVRKLPIMSYLSSIYYVMVRFI